MYVAETDRLRLRSWRDADAGAGLRLWGDPVVMAKIAAEPVADRAGALEIIRFWREHEERHGCCVWAVEESATGEVVGACGLDWIDGFDRFELSFQFVRDRWGRGYATEAGRAAVAYGFDTLGLDVIVAGTLGEHPASARVLEKIGFSFVDARVWPDTGKPDPYYELARR